MTLLTLSANVSDPHEQAGEGRQRAQFREGNGRVQRLLFEHLALSAGYELDWEKLFKSFEQSRKPNADAIAELALQNFIEMRDLVGDKKFLLRKKIEAWFHEKHPDKWLSLYSQVTFSPHVPYSVALANGKRQDKIMERIMLVENIEERWNSEEVEKEILNMI